METVADLKLIVTVLEVRVRKLEEITKQFRDMFEIQIKENTETIELLKSMDRDIKNLQNNGSPQMS